MRVNLTFVPPDGGEAEYSLSMELPGIPSAGDYISVSRADRRGSEDFIVRRTWWQLVYSDKDEFGTLDELWVECEFALGSHSSDNHKRACERHQAKTGKLLKFDVSMY